MKELMLNVLERIAYYTLKGLYFLIVAALIWIFLSYLDVVFHNTSVSPVYAPWNFFTLEVLWG